MQKVESSFPAVVSILPTRVDVTTIPLTMSCLQTIIFQATHFLYLRDVVKRPYLSFRASKHSGDPLNDTEVLITRVLCATPMLFTILQALSTASNADEAVNVVGHILASLVLLGILWSMKRLVFGLTDPLKSFRASTGQDRDSDRRGPTQLTRANSAASEEGVSDKIEAMMNTKNAIERWEFERTLKWERMTDEEKSRWKVETEHNHPSNLKMFCLVIIYVCGVVFLLNSFLLLVINSASTSWAQWLWFTAAMLGWISVDAYAVKCLSGEEGDIIHSYLRGFFRSTSKQAKDEEVDDVAVEIENADEENPVTEEEEVVSSPVHSNENNKNTPTPTPTPTPNPTDKVVELTEVNQKSRPRQKSHKRPSIIRTPSSKPSVPVSTLMKKIEAPKKSAALKSKI